MTINANSRLFKYAFLLSDNKRHAKQTSLCGLFWRCVFTTVVLVIPVFLLSSYIYGLATNFWGVMGPTLFVIGVVSVLLGLGWLDDTIKERRRERERRSWDPDYVEPEPGVVATTIYAVKNRVCPIIKIVR